MHEDSYTRNLFLSSGHNRSDGLLLNQNDFMFYTQTIRRTNMKTSTSPHETMSRDAILIGRILESFEAMEDTLSGLNLEEPLFITRVAKKAFAKAIFNEIKPEKHTRQ